MAPTLRAAAGRLASQARPAMIRRMSQDTIRSQDGPSLPAAVSIRRVAYVEDGARHRGWVLERDAPKARRLREAWMVEVERGGMDVSREVRGTYAEARAVAESAAGCGPGGFPASPDDWRYEVASRSFDSPLD